MSVSSYTFLIANGAAASQEISLGSAVLVGLTFDGWKSGTGVYLKSRPTSDGVKSAVYRSDGNYMLQGTIPVANMFVSLPEDEMRGHHWVTLCSGTPGADVNQNAERTVTISVVYVNPRKTNIPQNLSVITATASGEIHSDTLISCSEDADIDGDVLVGGNLVISPKDAQFRLLGYTTSAAVPGITELPEAGDACIHYDSNGDKYYLAFNIGSETIVKVEMT